MKKALASLVAASAVLVTANDGALAQPTSYSIVPITGNNYSPIDSGTVAGRSINSGRQVALYFGKTLYLWSPGTGLLNVGTVPGPFIFPKWLNDHGEVAGFFRVEGSTNLNHAFTASLQSGVTDIGTFGGVEAEARGINNSGTVVGWAHGAGSNSRRPFVWTSDAGMTDPDPSSYYGEALGINGSGSAVGFSWILGGYSRAKIWPSEGGVIDLGAPVGSQSVGRAVNERGDVAGDIIFTIGGPQTAFRYSGGALEDLGTLGGPRSRAQRINDNGMVVGYSVGASGSERPFAWTPSTGMVDIGLPGSPAYHTGLNNQDHVVGYVVGASGYYQPYIWSQARGAVDLNTLIPCRPTNWRAYTAHGISDDGAILVLSSAGPALLTPGSACGIDPVLGPIAADDPIAVNVPLQTSASFTDGDTADAHTGIWDWGDGTSSNASVTESAGEGKLIGVHSFSSAGVYQVTLTVTDSGGRSTQGVRDVVVYDPSAGFVTGGGWFMSPLGAYKADTSLTGFANFGFVSRYQKGASVPTGKTEFKFQTANLNFHSDSYDWLVVSGARAQYKGTGSINGTGDFRFLLTAVDGDRLGGPAPDRFRIKIWYYDSVQQEDVTVYDNQMETSLVGGYDEGAAVSGGSIVIHTK
jgi:probable HAF family extracellular repeat protein